MIESQTAARARDLSSTVARIVQNRIVCRDHRRLTLRVDGFAEAHPGQFVHLCPPPNVEVGYRTWSWEELGACGVLHADDAPMLRRAYSIAALRRTANGVEIDIIFRVVGKGTRWLQSLREGNEVSVLGPLGNAFPISQRKSEAWLVSGGVGLPPILWLAEALRGAGKRSVAFCGAQSSDLLALTLEGPLPSRERAGVDGAGSVSGLPSVRPDRGATRDARVAEEFSSVGTPVVISTDDGSMGFHGHIGAALQAFAAANPPNAKDLVVYTCGPERMLRFVAEFCVARDIECHLCMERAMACGTGMCQSCVVPVRDTDDSAGWRYRLCCTDGPIFAASEVLWERPA